jgi:hypothetical protein
MKNLSGQGYQTLGTVQRNDRRMRSGIVEQCTFKLPRTMEAKLE